MATEVPPKTPKILMLPCDGLVVPDWNPRKFMERGPLLDLMAHIQAGGNVLRILVWGGDGKSVISGQRRLLAYRRLGKTHIEAEILDISLEEARKMAITSNAGAPLYWLDKYESWEPYWVKDGLAEDVVAATVGEAKTWIRRAKQLLAVLSPASRGLIREKLEEYSAQEDAENKGNNDVVQDLHNDTETLKKRMSENREKWLLLEDVAFLLTALWDKRSIQEAQALAEEAMPTILSNELNGPQVKAMVAAMKAGTQAQDFVPAPPKKKVPRAQAAPAAQGSVGVGTPVAHTPASTPAPTPAPAPQTGGVWSLVGGILWKEVKGKASRAFHRFIPRIPGWAHTLAARFQKLGVKERVWTVFLTAGLILVLANFLLHQATHVLTHILFRPAPLSTGPTGGQSPAVRAGAGTAPVSAQAGEQAVAEPGQGNGGNGGAQGGVAAPVQAPVTVYRTASTTMALNAAAPSMVQSKPANPVSLQGAAPGPSVPVKPKGEDVVKQVNDGLNVLSNGASAVNNTASAVDQAKKILGF